MAKFDPCGVLPDPGEQQDVVKSSNRFGCYYRAKSPWHAFGFQQKLSCKRFPPTITYGPRNWFWYRRLNFFWSHVLTAAQRTAWDVLAGLTPYTNYFGSTGRANGYSIFFKLNRIGGYNGFPVKLNPPGSWNALEVPAVESYSLFPGNDLIVLYPVDFNPPPELSGGAVITLEPKASSRYPAHYFCQAGLTWGFNGFNWITDVFIDCPFFNNRQGGQCTVGIFHFRTDTQQFTDFFWMRVG